MCLVGKQFRINSWCHFELYKYKFRTVDFLNQNEYSNILRETKKLRNKFLKSEKKSNNLFGRIFIYYKLHRYYICYMRLKKCTVYRAFSKLHSYLRIWVYFITKTEKKTDWLNDWNLKVKYANCSDKCKDTIEVQRFEAVSIEYDGGKFNLKFTGDASDICYRQI